MKCPVCEMELKMDEVLIRISYGKVYGLGKCAINFQSGRDEYICKKCTIEYNLMCK